MSCWENMRLEPVLLKMDDPIQDVDDFAVNWPHQISDLVPYGLESTQQFTPSFVPLDYGVQIQNTSNDYTESSKPLQRMRWTDEMVKLLITAVSCFLPDQEKGHPSIPVKGKWRSISSAMAEGGHIVKPQQCEDKFNDLIKKFKKLHELVGRRVNWESIRIPGVIESMNIPEEAKKLLSGMQFFYHELCVYHDDKNKKQTQNGRAKRQRRGEINNNACLPERVFSDKTNAERELWIQEEMLKLEKMKLEWLEICKEEDKELDKMRHENEVMRLENERLAFELRRRERCQCGPSGTIA